MSIQNREVEVSVHHGDHGRTFTGIRELGFTAANHVFVISGWTTPFVAEGEPRGSYFTAIPISGREYRRTRTYLKSGFKRTADNVIFIYDDYGIWTKITAPGDVVDALTKECMDQGLVERAGE